MNLYDRYYSRCHDPGIKIKSSENRVNDQGLSLDHGRVNIGPIFFLSSLIFIKKFCASTEEEKEKHIALPPILTPHPIPMRH